MLRLFGFQLAAATLALGFLVGCGGGGDGGTPPPTTAIAKASGDEQVGIVGQPLADPITVTVTDAGAASAGTTVTFATPSGGSLDPTSAVTDANGSASATWTLGTTAGPQTATATVSGASGSPVTFAGTANPGEAAALSEDSGNGQTGVINTALAQPLQVMVADQFGNGVSGINVTWTASGGTLSSGAVATDASGISAVTLTLGGTAGPVTATAAVEGLTGSPVTFNETASTAPPVPTTASVKVGPGISFTSNRNGTLNPAVDTVAVGGTVTWSWAAGSIPHSVLSTGSPSFTSSSIMSSGSYMFTFGTAGTYSYACAVHGAAMSGTIVVR
jgi:plastocyanin